MNVVDFKIANPKEQARAIVNAMLMRRLRAVENASLVGGAGCGVALGVLALAIWPALLQLLFAVPLLLGVGLGLVSWVVTPVIWRRLARPPSLPILIRRDRTLRKAVVSLVAVGLLASIPAFTMYSAAGVPPATVTFLHGEDPSWPDLLPDYLDVIATNASSLSGCATAAQQPCVVALAWTVDHEGRVRDISQNGATSACVQQQCIEAALERWQFPPGRDDALQILCPFGFGQEGEVTAVSTPQRTRSIIR